MQNIFQVIKIKKEPPRFLSLQIIEQVDSNVTDNEHIL